MIQNRNGDGDVADMDLERTCSCMNTIRSRVDNSMRRVDNGKVIPRIMGAGDS